MAPRTLSEFVHADNATREAIGAEVVKGAIARQVLHSSTKEKFFMFHWSGSLFFGRRADGSVRVVKFTQAPTDWPKADDPHYVAAEIDVTIPAAEWASIMSSVSKNGETSESYQAAVAFHG